MRADEQLSTLRLPVLSPSEAPHFDREDCLVLCAGFEDRAIDLLAKAVKEGSRRFQVVIVEYLPDLPQNRGEQILSLCRAAEVSPHHVSYDRRDPAGGGEAIVDIARNCGARLHIDLSGMSRLLIVQCIVALLANRGTTESTRVWYAEAMDYPPPREEVHRAIAESKEDPAQIAMFLSSGVFGVSIVPELSGPVLRSASIRLVVFPSFNTDQFVALRAEIPASGMTVIHGVPPNTFNSWRLESIRALNHIEMIPGTEEVQVSTLDYREALGALLTQYRQYSERERLVVAPTGSKMQALAVGVLRAFLTDVEIAYPTPARFDRPERYTKGVARTYTLSLDEFREIQQTGVHTL